MKTRWLILLVAICLASLIFAVYQYISLLSILEYTTLTEKKFELKIEDDDFIHFDDSSEMTIGHQEDIDEFEIELSKEDIDSINECATPDPKYYTDEAGFSYEKTFVSWVANHNWKVKNTFWDFNAVTFSTEAIPYTIEFRDEKGGIMGSVVVDEKGLTLNFHELNINIVLPEKPTTSIHYTGKD